MKKEVYILSGIAIAVIAFGIVLFSTSAPDPRGAGTAVDAQSLIRTHSQRIGPDNAAATLVEFGDFQCPACAAAHPLVKQIIEANKDKSFQFVFRNLPLTGIHKNAQLSAEAAESAGNQGKYWEMHSLIYERQTEWSESNNAKDIFIRYAGELGLNVEQFTQDLDKRTFQEIISTDVADAAKLQVQSTPTFFFNGQRLPQTPSPQMLQQMIDEAIANQNSQTETQSQATSSPETSTSTLFNANPVAP